MAEAEAGRSGATGRRALVPCRSGEGKLPDPGPASRERIDLAATL
jgi:hypothetical protein